MQARAVKLNDMKRLAAYQRELRKKPELRYLFFELTDCCNLACKHCGSSCSRERGAFLDYATVERTLNQVSKRYTPNNIMVCLTGGEPLLYNSLANVVHLASSVGFPVGMTTNGTLIDNLKAEQLASAGLDTIAVSLDGIGTVHDEFRNAVGSFNKAVSGIRALRAVGLEPQIISVIHSKNISSLSQMYAFLQELGIYSWRLVNIDPIGRAKANGEYLLDSDGLRVLFDFILEKRRDPLNPMEVTYGCSHFLTLDYEHMLRDYYFQCGAGTQVASIAANGDILACLDIERRKDIVQGNIYHDDFISIWEHGFERFRMDRTTASSVCRECKYNEYCQGDSAHTWNYDEERPNYCVAKMLEEAKDGSKTAG